MHKKLILRLLFIFIFALFSTSLIYAQNSIEIGDTVPGSQEDSEWHLTLDEGQTVQIELESDEFDTILDLLGADGALITSNDDIAFPDNRNSRIIYTATASGTYTLRIRSFGSDNPEGSYTLSVTELQTVAGVEGGELEYGDEKTVEPQGASLLEFTFQGEADDVVNIRAVSEQGEDTNLTLIAPDGEAIAFADDSRSDINPFIIRLSLPQSGAYRIEVRSFEEVPLFTPITVRLEQTEELLLNDGAQTVTLGDHQAEDVMVLNATAGQEYNVLISLSEESINALFVEIQEADEPFPGMRLSFSGTDTISFRYVAEQDGQARFTLSFLALDNQSLDVTVEVEEMDS